MKKFSVVLDLGILALLSVVTFKVAWIGYQGWLLDDFHYLKAAEAWATDAPYLGDTHWELRYGFVLPLALAFKLFGVHEYSMVGVTIAFHLMSLAVTYFAVSALWGRNYGLFAALVVVFVPMVAGWATTPRVAIAEYFYCVVAFWSFLYAATNSRGGSLALLVSGVFLGLAWVTRETSIGVFAAFGVLFLLGYRLPRRRYWALALGALLVIGGEVVFHAAYSGNPFYRMHTSLIHGKITSTGKGLPQEIPGEPSERTLETEAASFVDRLMGHFDFSKIERQQSPALFHVNNWVDPYIQFFTEPYYGLVIWLGLPVALWFGLRKNSEPQEIIGFSRLALLFAGTWVMAALYLLFLRPLPRYFIFPAYMFAIVLGLGLARAWLSNKKPLVVAVAATYLSVNVVFMEARQGLGLYNARWALSFGAAADEVVIVDETTYRMLMPLLKSDGLSETIQPGTPTAGKLYFHDPQRKAGVRPGGRWEIVASHQSDPKWLGSIIDALGLRSVLPGYVYQRLTYPYGRAFIYRVPGENS
mgnify:FL=1